MRIAHFCDSHPDRPDGVSRSAELTVGLLRSAGHEVDFYRPGRVPSLPLPWRQIQVGSPWFRCAPADVFHAHTTGPIGMAAFRLAARRGVPLVVTWHTDLVAYADTYPEIPIGAAWCALQLRLGWSIREFMELTRPGQPRRDRLIALGRGMAERMAAAIAPSAKTAETFAVFGPRPPVHVLPTPLAPATTPPPGHHDEAAPPAERFLSVPPISGLNRSATPPVDLAPDAPRQRRSGDSDMPRANRMVNTPCPPFHSEDAAPPIDRLSAMPGSAGHNDSAAPPADRAPTTPRPPGPNDHAAPSADRVPNTPRTTGRNDNDTPPHDLASNRPPGNGDRVVPSADRLVVLPSSQSHNEKAAPQAVQPSTTSRSAGPNVQAAPSNGRTLNTPQGHSDKAMPAADRLPVTPGLPGRNDDVAPPIERMSAVQRRGGEVVLSVGRVSAEKNPGLLLDAFVLLRRRKPGARLVLLGARQGRAALESRLREMGLERHVEVLPPVPRAEVDAFYRTADVLAFASTTDTQSLVLAEAEAAGLPVVVADPALAARPGDGGSLRFTCAPRPDEFAAALGRMLDDEGLRARVVRDGLAATASYPAELYLARLEELYRRL